MACVMLCRAMDKPWTLNNTWQYNYLLYPQIRTMATFYAKIEYTNTNDRRAFKSIA